MLSSAATFVGIESPCQRNSNSVAIADADIQAKLPPRLTSFSRRFKRSRCPNHRKWKQPAQEVKIPLLEKGESQAATNVKRCCFL